MRDLAMIKHSTRIFTIISALLLAGSLISTSLYAQERGQPPADMMPHQQHQSFSDEQIQQFAEANKQVDTIIRAYSTRTGEAPSQEEAQALQEEANKKVVQAVKTAGLDIATYNNIARAASQDLTLRRKILEAQPH